MSTAAKVGALACQRNSFLKELTTKVVSCGPAAKAAKPGHSASQAGSKTPKEEPKKLFDVVCEDSVLFPEGGGQPWDLGTLNEAEVVSVLRKGDTCVITTTGEFEVGQEVKMKVDWDRRIDHMQHHSAQHLLTAVVERELKLPTECWALTHPYCYIQVPSASIAPEDVERVERICNDYIRDAVGVTCDVYPTREEVPASRSRGIPADVNGPIRVITLDDIDTCTCCGTHVTSLGQLSIIKLLHQEPKGQTCRLNFVVGQRVSRLFGEMFARERALMKELGANPQLIVQSVERRNKEGSDATKMNKKLYAELATFLTPEVAKAAAASKEEAFLFYREDVDMDFLTTVSAGLTDVAKAKICVLACGPAKGDGQFLVVGPSAADVKSFADAKLCPALEARGGQSKQGFRGKFAVAKWKAFAKSMSDPKKHADPTAAA